MAFGAVKGSKTGSATSITASFPIATGTNFAVVVGDLIVSLLAEQSANTVTACTDNLGNVYTALGPGADAGTVAGRGFYTRVTNAGTLTTVTFTATASSNNCVGLAVGFEGPFVVSPVDANPASIINDNTTPYTCPATGTLAQADELIVCAIVHNGAPTLTATAPNLKAVELATASILKAALGYQTVASTASVAPAWTSSATPTASGYATVSFKKELPLPSADAWNVDDKSANVALSAGDKLATTTSISLGGIRTTTPRTNGTAGKYYAELVVGSPRASQIGITPTSNSLTVTTLANYVLPASGAIYINNTSSGVTLAAFGANEVLSIAWDTGAERIWFRRGAGDWNNDVSADPATGVGGLDCSFAAAIPYAVWARFGGSATGANCTVRTERWEFTQAVPAGFSSWMNEVTGAGPYGDDFNRANTILEGSTATGAIGSGWSWGDDGFLAGALSIVSNQVFCNTTDATGSAYLAAVLDSDDQYVQFQTTSTTGPTGSFHALRMTDRNNFVGIRAGFGTSNGQVEIYRRVGGALTQLYTTAASFFVLGDVIRLEVSGGNYTAYKNGVAFKTDLINDGGALTGRKAGIVARSSSGVLADMFETGSLVTGARNVTGSQTTLATTQTALADVDVVGTADQTTLATTQSGTIQTQLPLNVTGAQTTEPAAHAATATARVTLTTGTQTTLAATQSTETKAIVAVTRTAQPTLAATQTATATVPPVVTGAQTLAAATTIANATTTNRVTTGAQTTLAATQTSGIILGPAFVNLTGAQATLATTQVFSASLAAPFVTVTGAQTTLAATSAATATAPATATGAQTLSAAVSAAAATTVVAVTGAQPTLAAGTSAVAKAIVASSTTQPTQAAGTAAAATTTNRVTGAQTTAATSQVGAITLGPAFVNVSAAQTTLATTQVLSASLGAPFLSVTGAQTTLAAGTSAAATAIATSSTTQPTLATVSSATADVDLAVTGTQATGPAGLSATAAAQARVTGVQTLSAAVSSATAGVRATLTGAQTTQLAVTAGTITAPPALAVTGTQTTRAVSQVLSASLGTPFLTVVGIQATQAAATTASAAVPAKVTGAQTLSAANSNSAASASVRVTGAQATQAASSAAGAVVPLRVVAAQTLLPVLSTGTIGAVAQDAWVLHEGTWKRAQTFVYHEGVWKMPQTFVNQGGVWKRAS